LTLYSFNSEYIRRLRDGDAEVQRHFSSYFGELLWLKLRARLRSVQSIEDIRQETMLRVLQLLRAQGGIEHPERFGAFVNSVCNHVLLEYCRAENRHPPMQNADPADPRADLDSPLVEDELKLRIRRTLERLPARQRDLLRAVFLEEADKREICRRYRVQPGHLRVLLHRARARFRSEYLRRRPNSGTMAM